jgi:hypothetical protein
MSGLELYFPELDAFDLGAMRGVLLVGIAEDLALAGVWVGGEFNPRQKAKGKRQN